jgi:hypothetical protein
VKFARRVLQAFMRPWLAAQTIFNREVARRFQSMHMVVHDLERRTPHLESGVHHLEERILALERQLNPEAAARGDVRRDLEANGIEHMFVHSRLPAPPSRVLLIGSSASAIVPELRSFGFDVVTVDAESNPVTGGGSLPFGAAEFEVVVCLMASSSAPNQAESAERLAMEASRVLRAGGRLLLTLRCGATAAATGEPAATAPVTLRPLEVAEMLARSDTDATLAVIVSSPVSAAPTAPAGTLFIDARRVDAPHH